MEYDNYYFAESQSNKTPSFERSAGNKLMKMKSILSPNLSTLIELNQMHWILLTYYI